jgi:K+-transporting ATPase ATPase C chain
MLRRSFVAQLGAGLRVLVVMTVALGVLYPLAVTVFAQVVFGDRADGSLVRVDGTVVGSRLIGQQFASPAYFHPRPSSIGYDSASSGGSNLGPTNPDFLDTVAARVAAYRDENGLAPDVAVPVDAVTASASGLDPDISPANARLQAPRVAAERGLELEAVLQLVGEHIRHRPGGFLGDDAVNVLALNVALDEVSGRP